MSEKLFSASPISWGTLITVLLAVAAGFQAYGQLNQRVQMLEDLQPVTVSMKLAVIEADGKRAAMDIARIQDDLAAIRRQLSRSGVQRDPEEHR